jgi:FkbM family methyltransferase
MKSIKNALRTLVDRNKFSIINLVSEFKIGRQVVLHVGGNEGQEIPVYDFLKIKKVIWVEGWPPFADRLAEKIHNKENHKLIQSMISDNSNELVDFHIASNGGSSTTLKVTEIWKKNFSTITMNQRIHKIKCERLDHILANNNFDEDIDLMVMDIEGAELKALISLGDYIERVKNALIEVSFRKNFVDGPLLVDIDKFMIHHQFIRVYIKMGTVSGDALYSKVEKVNISQRMFMKISAYAIQAAAILNLTNILKKIKDKIKGLANE